MDEWEPFSRSKQMRKSLSKFLLFSLAYVNVLRCPGQLSTLRGGSICLGSPSGLHKDNWLAVAKLRAQTEAANSTSGKETHVNGPSQTIAALVDDHHEF